MRQTKLEEYYKPPPQSADSIKSNSLVQNFQGQSNRKRKRSHHKKRPNGNLSPKSDDSNTNDDDNNNNNDHRQQQQQQQNQVKTHWFFNQNKNNNDNNNNNKNKKNKNKNKKGYTHLIAFDFDQTLSCVQVFNGSNRSAQDLFGGRYRVELIEKFLKYLKSESSKNGDKYRIIIISYNFTNIITARLKELKLLGYFEKIYDRYHVNKHGGYKKGKGNLLRLLSQKWNVNFERNALIIDDCDDVIWNCHCQTVHVSNFRGMNKYEMEQICRKFNLKIPNFVLSVV